MGDEEKRLQILIQTSLDDKGAKAAQDALNKTKKANQDNDKQVKKSTEGIKKMADASKDLEKIGVRMGIIGAAMSGPIVAATKNYVSTVGMAESTSRSWLSATYDLEQSYLRIGRVGAQVMLPWMRQAATLSKQAAGFAEQNPELVKGALEVGGVFAGAGVLGKGLGWMTEGLVGAGAEGAAGAGVGIISTVTALIPAVVAAALSYVAMSNIKLPGQSQSIWDSGMKAAGQAVTLGAGDLASIMPGSNADAVRKVMKLVGGATGAIGGNQTAPAADNSSSFVSTEMLQKMRQQQIQEQYAEEDNNRQRFVANRNFNLQMQYSEQDFYRSRDRSLRDFGISQVYDEQQFYRQRAIAFRDFSISVQRNEQDYNISRQRAAEDHNFDLKQIMLSGDALQYYYSQRQYNIDKQRQDQDYQLQKSRNSEDFNRQQADSAQQFTIQRTQQLKQYAIQLADQQQDFDINRKRQSDQFAIQMSDLDYQYNLEKQRRWQSFTESVLPEIMTEEQYRAKMISEMNTQMVSNFDQLMNQFSSQWSGFLNSKGTTSANAGGTSAPANTQSSTSNGIDWSQIWNIVNTPTAWAAQHAAGGYTKYGPALVHDHEFVLTANTTHYAEQVAKGNLTQNKIMAALSGNGGFQYNDNRSFSRGLDSTEHYQIQRETEQLVLEAFR